MAASQAVSDQLTETDDVIPLDVPSEEKGGEDADSNVSDTTTDSDGQLQQIPEIDPPVLISPCSAPVQCNGGGDGVVSPDSRKRRASSPASAVPSTRNTENKRLKVDKRTSKQLSREATAQASGSLLPAEIWHRIFTYLPPKTLGNLLCVNKLFNVYLDASSTFRCTFPVSLCVSHIPQLRPEAIWQASRRCFWPKMPVPLRDKSELEMWRLACQTGCQFCEKTKTPVSQSSSDHWLNGPGLNGIRTVWAFGLRTCGQCLSVRSLKEIDLLLSSSMPSVLIPALSFVFVTDDMHLIPPTSLQNGQIPPDFRVTKLFSSSDVDKIQNEFLSVKSMGKATMEEWLKGLEDRGKKKRSDSLRWEKWELSSGIVQMNKMLSPEILRNTAAPSHKSALHELDSAALIVNRSGSQLSVLSDKPVTKGFQSHLANRPTVPHSAPTSNPPRSRTRVEVMELKAARRVEIERRAMELEPPLPPHVLIHIPSFQAALQIITPLDDSAWDVLRPRLLAQRAEAEQRGQLEQEADHQSRIAQERAEERLSAQDANQDITKQQVDKDWDDIQIPLQSQLSAFAAEIIRDGWRNGQNVNNDTSPQFATEVLMYVRRRFYAEVSKDLAVTQAAGQKPALDPPDCPFPRMLTLENMKWLFDAKIRPITDPYRRELFFCNGCEGSRKLFGFEGVVQHYAAKHTSALSLGSVVVHWQAEWPDVPPFHPNPRIMQATHPVQNRPPSSQHVGLQPSYTTHPALSPLTPYPPPPYTTSGFAASTYGEQASSLHNPRALGQAMSYAPLCQVPGQQYSHQPASFGRFGSSPQTSYSSLYPYRGPPTYPPGDGLYAQTYQIHQNTYPSSYIPFYGGPPANTYHPQLEDIARNSRELWITTASLKDLPGSIRVFVVLHHVVARFKARFLQMAPLTFFSEGLSNNKEMRPVRNVNGLVCKACKSGLDNTYVEDQDKTYSLPRLVNHFQQQHIEQSHVAGAPILDWSVDMVFISDLSVLSNLRNLTNMDTHKFTLISDAFPPANYPSGYSQPMVTAAGESSSYSTSHSQGHAATGVEPSNNSVSRHLEASKSNFQEITSSPVDLGVSKPETKSTNKLSTFGAPSDSSRAIPEGSDRGTNSKSVSMVNPRNHQKQPKGDNKHSDHESKANVSSDEDPVAEEQQRRQEEEIRAMWAADRRDTARVVSVHPTAVRGAESLNSATSSDADIQKISVPTIQSRSTSPNRGMKQPSITVGHSDDESNDLMAGLETQLKQQSGYAVQQRRPYDDPPQLRRSESPAWQQLSDQALGPEGSSSRSPTNVRYEAKPDTLVRKLMLSVGHLERDYDSRRVDSGVTGDVSYMHAPHREYVDTPLDNARCSPIHSVDMYELIRVRDHQGDYFIRRPVRQVTSSVHGERFTPYSTALSRAQSQSYQPTDEGGRRSSCVFSRSIHRVPPHDDTASLDEYDPRFPTLPVDAEISRRIQYE
ncbi:hypothetical protein F5Y15DRAFT_206134 [Xylariaceae sp. FL0016]|nr:hypothetical protein F5Y15DRAFT_206134 [Xylariaceae sp. FL0016]